MPDEHPWVLLCRPGEHYALQSRDIIISGLLKDYHHHTSAAAVMILSSYSNKAARAVFNVPANANRTVFAVD